MPNFCAIDIKTTSQYVQFNRQRATLNEEQDDYIYKSNYEVLKKDNLRVVYVQNTEDTDIKKLAVSRHDTREEYMNWNTDSGGKNVGFETIIEPANAMLGNQVNGNETIDDAVNELFNKMGVSVP